LAVRTETPIFVAEAVFDQAGIVTPTTEEGAEDKPTEVDETKLTPFKEFIESLDIDDLGGGSESKS
jgi:bifunctional DNase/RNase